MAAPVVSKDTLIGDLLKIDANVAPILMGIGMHCLGCPASQGETIEEAAYVHGIDPAALVQAINEVIAQDAQQARKWRVNEAMRKQKYPRLK